MHFRPTDSPVVKCTKCGARLFVPEASEYCDAHNVRHPGNASLAATPLRLPFALGPNGDGVGPTSNDP